MQRYALIIAGGSGTRLWPMSTARRPKQLIPLIGGKCLLEIAVRRISKFIDSANIFICAGSSYKQIILDTLDCLDEKQFIGEPEGRDTLNAIALGVGVIARRDPKAAVGIFTADHLIEPEEIFQKTVLAGFEIAEKQDNTIITFGITPTHPATGYGYLQLKEDDKDSKAHSVSEFKEKPNAKLAQKYFDAGKDKYLWNSGMFIFQTDTLLRCVQKFNPDNYEKLNAILDSWDTEKQEQTIQQIYPQLKKISIDYAVMEPAARDQEFNIKALPMNITWLDVGSWTSVAQTKQPDEAGNVCADNPTALIDSKNTLAISEDVEHLITAIGCEDLIIIHTQNSTLVCRADKAEQIKQLHAHVKATFGEKYV